MYWHIKFIEIKYKNIEPKKYLLIWALIGIGIALIDWYDHISRPNQSFRLHSSGWLAYTLIGLSIVLTSAVIINYSLKSFIKFQFIRELLSFILSSLVFQALGKWINQITVPEIQLHFQFAMQRFLIILMVYSLFYFIINYLSIKLR
jgi:hypothetical protein